MDYDQKKEFIIERVFSRGDVEDIRQCIRYSCHENKCHIGTRRKKDLFDIYELLQHYPLTQIMDWYYEKYHKQILAISIPQALIYFDEANHSQNPVSLKNITWEEVSDFIRYKVNEFLG